MVSLAVPDITPTFAREDAAIVTAQTQLGNAQRARDEFKDYFDESENDAHITSKKKGDIRKKWNQKNNAVTAAAEQVTNAQRARAQAENDAKNNMCAKMRNRFAQGNPGTWTFVKTKKTEAGTPIIYYKQRVKYFGTEYLAVAHIHGTMNAGTWTYGGVPDKLEFKKLVKPQNGDGVVCEKVAMGQTIHPQVSTVGHTDGATQWSPNNQVAMPNIPYPAHVEQAMDYIYDDPVGAGGDTYVMDEYISSVPGGFDPNIVVLSVVMTVLACVLCAFMAFCVGGLFGFVFGSLFSGRREVAKETNNRYDVVEQSDV